MSGVESKTVMFFLSYREVQLHKLVETALTELLFFLKRKRLVKFEFWRSNSFVEVCWTNIMKGDKKLSTRYARYCINPKDLANAPTMEKATAGKGSVIFSLEHVFDKNEHPIKIVSKCVDVEEPPKAEVTLPETLLPKLSDDSLTGALMSGLKQPVMELLDEMLNRENAAEEFAKRMNLDLEAIHLEEKRKWKTADLIIRR